MTRWRALAVLALSLAILLGGTLAITSATTAAAAQSDPTPPLPLPTADTCPPDSPLPVCHLPAPTAVPSPTGLPTTPPCVGEGCIPQPTSAAAPPPSNPGSGSSGDSGDPNADCGLFSPVGCIADAIDGFFRGIVNDALNPLLDLLSHTLLTTPTPDSIPRIGQLWDNSWQILLGSYVLLVVLAGVIVMGYQTVQTRHSLKEIAPRVIVGFLAGALSLWLATKGIEIANAVAQAVMGGGVDALTAADTLRNLVMGSLNGGIFIIFIGIFLAGMLVCLLVTYVVRVALTLLLIAGAPLALMFHALPQTEGIPYWWYKAYGGVLVIQIGQSGVLIIAFRVFLAPGGFTLFGPTTSGLINLLVALALMYILFKIPFWILGSIRGGGGRRSLVGSLVRGFLAYKTFGLLGGRSGGKPRPAGDRGDASLASKGGGRGRADRYTRTAADGQYILPLTGVRRTRPAAKPQHSAAPKPRTAQIRQLALPLRDDWPEHRPVLGRDGQYRLPLDGVRRTPHPSRSRPSPPAATPPRTRVTQPPLPFDPYLGNRAHRSGQYPLPLEGVRRVPPTKPVPATPPPRPTPPAGQQLRLPLDLPKPLRRTRPTSGGTS